MTLRQAVPRLKHSNEKLEAELKSQAGEDEEKLKELLEANRITVSVAGRVMSRRLMGKASFFVPER